MVQVAAANFAAKTPLISHVNGPRQLDLIKLLEAAEKLHRTHHVKWPRCGTATGDAVWSPMAARCGKTAEQCRSKIHTAYAKERDEGDPLYLKAHQADLMLDDVRTNFDESAEGPGPERARTKRIL